LLHHHRTELVKGKQKARMDGHLYENLSDFEIKGKVGFLDGEDDEYTWKQYGKLPCDRVGERQPTSSQSRKTGRG